MSSTSRSEAPHTTDWEAPGDYEFTLRSSCGERNLIGEFRIVVASGSVAGVEALDERGRAVLEHGLRHEVPTLSELLQNAATAAEQGADVVEVRTADDGRPTEITIDGRTRVVDDEECYTVTQYSAAG